ncbi:hypothetical protein MT356_18485 [Rathayibacter festucae]|uniref:hypothetical protein n=1 Tax=Rathayibacter festucae TaxID=110937 RepID=UPI001FB34614|nr:hypothetical protein [Rathayibacter festucae]MCJ1701698.1 hypothetical protein [Rathayibacter festucae]
MRLWKTTAICSTAALLAGLSAAPATAAPAEGGAAVAAAVAPAQDLSAPLTGHARDLETPGHRLVQVEERTVEYRVVDPAATPAPKRTLTFTNPPQAPSAARLEVRYQQSNGDFFKEVSPLLQPGGPAWQTTLQGDDREVDLQVKDASGEVLAERSYPGEMPAGNPTVAWFYRSVFNLPGYTFTW